MDKAYRAFGCGRQPGHREGISPETGGQPKQDAGAKDNEGKRRTGLADSPKQARRRLVR